ncbi:MAG: cyclic nucleotide-binding domain-containing protein [Planctomycetota bacterium]
MLDLAEKKEALRKGIFSDLDEDTLEALAGRMGERELEDEENLFLSGEPGDEIFVIVEGEVDIYINEHVIAVLGPGALFGEMAVLGGGKRTASGRAKGALRLLFLKEKAIKILIQQLPDLAFAIFKVLIERLEEANKLAMFLENEKVVYGEVVVNSGDLAGKTFQIYHKEAPLGKAKNSAAADSLRIALPAAGGDLLDKHALVTIKDGIAYIEPKEGEVLVHGAEIDDCFELAADDEVEAGGLNFSIKVK